MTPNYDKLIWSRTTFPNKVSDDEDVILIVREDLIILLIRFLKLFIVYFLFLLVRVILLGFANSLFLALYDTVMYGVNVLLVTRFALIFHNFYLSLQIVTSHRIIDIDQVGLFQREVNQLSLAQIEDVTSKQTSFVSTLFNFGDVVIQTAGSTGHEAKDTPASTHGVSGFVFNNVPDAPKVANLISKLYHESQDTDRKKTAQMHADFLKDALHKKPQA